MAIKTADAPDTPVPIVTDRKSLHPAVVRLLTFVLIMALVIMGLGLHQLYLYVKREMPQVIEWLPAVGLVVCGLIFLVFIFMLLWFLSKIAAAIIHTLAAALNHWIQATKPIIDSEANGLFALMKGKWLALHLQTAGPGYTRDDWRTFIESKGGRSSRSMIKVTPDVDPLPPLELFPLDTIREQTHTAVIGSTGTGKSLFTRWLIKTYFSDAHVRAYDLDADIYDWGDFEIAGLGGNIDDIAKGFQADLDEHAARNSLQGRGLFRQQLRENKVQELVRIIEEVNDTQTIFKQQNNPVMLQWIEKLLRRGRRYKFKVFAVGQQFDVESWGIRGQGSLRKAFTVVYLGSHAHDILSNLNYKDPYRHQLQAFLMTTTRPAIVEKRGQLYAAEIPDLTPFEQAEDRKAEAEFSRRHQEQQPGSMDWDTEGPMADTEPMVVEARPMMGSQKDAEEFLRECLKTPQLSSSVLAQGQRLGYSESTIRRAKKALKVESVRRGDLWFWLIP